MTMNRRDLLRAPIVAQGIEAAARRSGLQGILDFFARRYVEPDVSP